MKKLILIAAVFVFWAQAAQASDKAFDAIHAFYAARNYEKVWTNDGAFTRKARVLPEILEGAKAEGLDPESFGLTRIKSILDGTATPDTPKGWQDAELLFTYSVWSYASELEGEPMDAATLESVLDGDVADNLAALAPDQPLYNALKGRLAALDAESSPAKVTPINFGRRELKPLSSAQDVAVLRARMVDYGAMALPTGATPEQAATYDDTLVKAVKRFQDEYGLKSDGKVGQATLQLLNRTAADERMQIVANMQRLREPHRRLREDNRIEVSIARYWLTGYTNGHEAISMPVIVGKPTRQTISFRTEISGVRLNPTWTVPPTIKKEDFIPMLMTDPAKLVRMHGVKVVHDGKNVDPAAVEWAKMSPKELSQVKFWRPAGDGNPLGRYRVIMENPYDIYLHDTNHPDLFADSMRAQSSGCVRVARPEELSNFILSSVQGWNPQKTKDFVGSGRTHDVYMENKMPIYLDYMTAWLNSRNQVILGIDIYSLDRPRYDGLVKSVLTTQRNTQRILDRASDILSPSLQEAQHREPLLAQSTN